MLVGEELDLDVPRPLDVALAEDGVVAEGGLSLRRVERLLELVSLADDAHPSAAAARGGLDDEREADLVRLACGQYRYARLARDALGFELVAATAQSFRRRPHKR